MEEKRIEAVKNWPEPKSVRDIQVFIGFANFYWQFIQGFSRIAAPLISMLKTSLPSSGSQPGRVADRVDGGVDGETGSGDGSNRKSPKSRKSGNSEATEEPNFLIPEARTAFNLLRQAFTKAPILQHFNPKCHIRIETNASGYAIGDVLSQLTFDQLISDPISSKSDFGQWHLVAYFSRKMIPAETRYKTYDGELLAIVEAFKTWWHYLEGCKHEVLVLTDHNNLC